MGKGRRHFPAPGKTGFPDVATGKEEEKVKSRVSPISEKFTEKVNSLQSFLAPSLKRMCMVGAKGLVSALILLWLCRGGSEPV